MTCPYCEKTVAPTAQQCDFCHLTFPKASVLFGVTPRIHREVFDSTRQLTPVQQKEILNRIFHMREKYPQLYVQVVLHSFPPPHPLRTQVFWMFNAAAFSGETLRGPENHTILIAIDPLRQEAAMMPGYGLEPFLDQNTLNDVIQSAEPHWARGDWLHGVVTLLDRLDPLLEGISHPYHRKPPGPSEF